MKTDRFQLPHLNSGMTFPIAFDSNLGQSNLSKKTKTYLFNKHLIHESITNVIIITTVYSYY